MYSLVVTQFEFRGYATIVYKSVVTQIEDPGVHGQEGAPRRGGGPPERGLHHFKAPDGATYVLYIYFVCDCFLKYVWCGDGTVLEPDLLQLQKI